jgi:hypothetical protein
VAQMIPRATAECEDPLREQSVARVAPKRTSTSERRPRLLFQRSGRAAVGVVKLSGATGALEATARESYWSAGRSRAHSGLSDVLPDGVWLGADLAIGEGRESVPTRAEVVADGTKRAEEALRVLG